MSYTYLQEQEGGFLQECSSDIPRFARWKLNLTAEKSYCNGSETASSRDSRSGTTCEHSTERLGVEKPGLSLAEVRVRALVRQEQTLLNQDGQELTEEAVSFFMNTYVLLKRHNRNFVFGKTRPRSLLKDLKKCSKDLTRWGITRDGECLSVEAKVRTTSESECTYLPTPTAHNSKEGAYPAEYTRNTPTLAAQVGGKIKPEWNEWRMGLPIKWTDLKPLAMDNFRVWLRSHFEH